MATTKITASLPDSVLADLRALAADRGLTLSAALRQAITSAKFISDQTKDGHGTLLIEKSNGEKQRIVFQ